MRSVTNLTTVRAILDANTASMAVLDASNLGLTKAAVTPTRSSVLADFTAHECDFSGYARALQTWGTAHSLTDGIVRAPGALNEFALNATTTTNSVYNLFLVDSAGTGLLGAATLAAPFPLTTLNAGLLSVPCFPWQAPAAQQGIISDLLMTNHALRLCLNTLTGMSGLLHSAKAHLSTYSSALTVDTPLSTLSAAEATYSGYAAQTISTWSAAYVDSDGVPKVGGSDLLWAPTGSGATNTITVVYVTDSTSATLLFAYQLDTPQVLSGVDTGFRNAPTLWWGY